MTNQCKFRFSILLSVGFFLITAFGQIDYPVSSVWASTDLFFDDFESDLSQWVGKEGGAHHGIIVDDPLRPDNHVVTFTDVVGGGDMFGSEVPVVPGQKYVLSFEYLGVPDLGGESGNLGGFIGFAENTPGGYRWLAGTILCCDAEDDPLIDDGQWHTYIIQFDPFAPGNNYDGSPINNTIRVMLGDFFGIAGDVFFDNIRLETWIEVDIDIKPGSDSNPINPRSKGVIPVAIITTESFDATTVNPLSVTFGPSGATESHGFGHIEDVDNDGDDDLVLHFRTQLTGITKNDTFACLSGETYSGVTIGGCDAIKTVGK